MILCAAVCTASPETSCAAETVLLLSDSAAKPGAGPKTDLTAASGYTDVFAATAAYENAGVKDGLLKENGHYRYYEDGKRLANAWVTVGSDTYYFASDGNASVLSCRIGGTYYVFDAQGRLIQPSRKKIVTVKTGSGKSKKYYVDTKGAAISGWSADKKHYAYETGELAAGVIMQKGKFYYFSSGGTYSEAKTKKIRQAAKYEKPLSGVVKYLGKPNKKKYLDSCYGAGKDGIWTYDGFVIYTFRPDRGREIYMGAE